MFSSSCCFDSLTLKTWAAEGPVCSSLHLGAIPSVELFAFWIKVAQLWYFLKMGDVSWKLCLKLFNCFWIWVFHRLSIWSWYLLLYQLLSGNKFWLWVKLEEFVILWVGTSLITFKIFFCRLLRKHSFYFSCIGYAAKKNFSIIYLSENYTQVLYNT